MTKKIKEKNKKSIKLTKSRIKKVQNNQDVQKKEEESDKIKKIKIRVIGIGGGGGTIVSEIANRISKANFVAANTDTQALKTINKKVDCFQFGQDLTRGLGTGMNVDLGREAAQNEKDKIEKLCQGYDICIIVACLGGGTGSGAAPVFAKISKSLGNITYGIFTLPFNFEGEKKMEIAKESLKSAKNYLDAITFIPNEKVFQIIDKTTPLKQAFFVINKNLSKSLESLIKTIYEPGLVNIDFADFKTIFQSKGKLTYLNTAELSKKDGSAKDLITQLFNSPLFPYNAKGASGVLFNIIGGKDLSLSEINQISNSISELVSSEAKIVFGLLPDKNSESIIKTTLLAVGCGAKEEMNKKPKKSIIIKKTKRVKKKSLLSQKITNSAESVLSNKLKIKVLNDFKKDELLNQESLDKRKSALQVKKETQELEKEIEKEILDQEDFWKEPAFLRRK